MSRHGKDNSEKDPGGLGVGGMGLLVKMVTSIVGGISLDEAADLVNKGTRKQGKDPVVVWRVVYGLAGRQLDILDSALCSCERIAQHPPTRCLNCGCTSPHLTTVEIVK